MLLLVELSSELAFYKLQDYFLTFTKSKPYSVSFFYLKERDASLMWDSFSIHRVVYEETTQKRKSSWWKSQKHSDLDPEQEL